jgi:flagellar motor switch/type III secretory pathway protein FliN
MTATSSPLPFPWKSLEATTASDLATLREVSRWVQAHLRPAAFVGALRDLLGADLRILVRRARPWMPGRGEPLGVGVLLTRVDDDATSAGALLDVEPALAAAVVARAIRRPVPIVVDGARPASPDVAGALAAVLLAAARRAHAWVPARILGAGDPATMLAKLATLGPDVVDIAFTVLLADEAFIARLLVARDPSLAAPEMPWTRDRLSALGALPISIPVVASATPATVGDLAVLVPGDVWVPDAWPLGRGAEAALSGPVLLAAPSSETGVRARLVEGGHLVLSGEVEPMCAAEATMVEGERESTLLQAVGDVPILVRVEIGEARMTAREWAAIGRGDVVTLGRRVGAQVLLRVGGVPVALGELVSVDGEVGVRIAERVAGDPTIA